MSERAAEIDDFLTGHGWGTAMRQPLAGDLSTRRYMRLKRSGKTAILMDADEAMQPFLYMTSWLREAGFSAPEVLAERAAEGLLLLEDFGNTSVNAHAANTGDTFEIDALCVDLLLELRAQKPPALAAPDAATLVDWTRLADQFYPGIQSSGLEPFRAALLDALQSLDQHPTVSLRDFHADNLIWLAERSGINRLGLLDYQDAFLTHPVYDLVSYLTDARVDVSADRRQSILQTYIDRSGDDEDEFRAAFSAVSAQRNLRILGIFAKGAVNGKPHHLSKLPRVHGYFAEALNHEMFRDVKEQSLTALPDPLRAIEVLS